MAKGNYIFPNILAGIMKKITLRTQYEATLMSLTFILVGLIIFSVYLVIVQTSLFVRIMIIVNGLAGFIFLSSHLITTFQQYQDYLISKGIIEKMDRESIENKFEKARKYLFQNKERFKD